MSDVGRVRENNEDSLIEAPEIGLYGVCDGLGGHAAGEIASGIASSTLREVLSQGHGSPVSALIQAVETANRRILSQQADNPEQQGMGTTLSMLWIRSESGEGQEESSWIAHVGDSRIYRWRERKLHQITKDHSPVFRLHQQGYLTKDQVRQHPQRNLLDRSLGIGPNVEPDILPVSLCSGDRFLICTDGLSDALSDEEIADLLSAESLEDACLGLVDEANRRGGLDNITLVVLEVVEKAEGGRRAE